VRKGRSRSPSSLLGMDFHVHAQTIRCGALVSFRRSNSAKDRLAPPLFTGCIMRDDAPDILGTDCALLFQRMSGSVHKVTDCAKLVGKAVAVRYFESVHI